MRKAFKIIAMCGALIAAFSLCAFSASAATLINVNDCFVVRDAYVRYMSTSTTFDWLQKQDVAWNVTAGNTSGVLTFGGDLVNTPYLGFRVNFDAKTDKEAISVPAGYYMTLRISGMDMANLGSNASHTFYFNARVIDSLGGEHVSRTTPVYYAGSNYWQAFLTFSVGDGVKSTNITKVMLESDMPSSSSGGDSYDIILSFDVTKEPTADQLQHEELVGAIGDAADDIIENDNANHEELINGWTSPAGDPNGDVNDMTGNLGDAEEDALGGKTDDQIKQEMMSALGTDNLPSVGASVHVSNVFDNLLEAFGSQYEALLMLSLVLGLAAFLVGRSYRARGD